MSPLDRTLRRQLEATVVEAREIAESAARTSLNQLGVGEAAPYPHLSEPERDLRRKLRARARQLGDVTNGNGAKSLDPLVEEVAYEHWHRMLFARFLAENDLLMYPSLSIPVPVTLEECEDLAQQEGARDGWELAARFASRMLPQIFRQESPVFQMVFPPEYQKKLEQLVVELPVDVFTASDSLGWVYQFWQSKRKEEVNKSEVKIGARELPAVTQLFTEPYMVSFLLDNSLGAWWAARRLTKEDFATAESEEELKVEASLPGVPLEYLRFIRDENGEWSPAASIFDGWPISLSEFKVLDPCCGSGHFLVAAFEMLVTMRVELERLPIKDAVDAVLRDNLYGLEIDQRCVEIAAFALAFAAWRYPGTGGYRQLPKLNVACSGLAICAKKEEWVALFGRNQNLRFVMQQLYEQFRYAPVLGSLIDPEMELGKGTLSGITWENVEPLLESAYTEEQSDEKMELGIVAQGTVRAAQILVDKYHLVITNVPYLGIRKQCDVLKKYNSQHHKIAKGDIATVFLDKYLKRNIYDAGCYSVVTPSAITNKNYFKNLRKEVLEKYTIKYITFLGPRAFETITGEVVDIILLNIIKKKPNIDTFFWIIDVFHQKQISEKKSGLKFQLPITILQSSQLLNPDFRIQTSSYGSDKLLLNYCECPQGIKTGDDEKWIKRFWEIIHRDGWEFCQSASQNSNEFGGLENIIDWSTNGTGMIRPRLDSPAIGKKAVGLSQTGKKRPVFFIGVRFDSSIAPILPKKPDYLLPIWTYCSSPEFIKRLEENSRSLYTTNTALLQVPFDIQYWKEVSQNKFPNGLPKPYSEDPTQWIFHGHPMQSDEPLQVAVARLLGYRWPAELDIKMELSKEANKWIKKSEAALPPYIDTDGIVCIPSIRGEPRAEVRLENLLAAAYGNEWSVVKKGELLAQANNAGRTLESWLRDKFFTQHCKLFKNRPFIWHLWDGLPDGFAALLNYHKLDRKLLETLIYTYLGDWINRQKQEIANGVDGAEEKLAAAETLKRRLELILVGESPYDIFVRWKPIEKQPIGWDPDINDGVRINIRPFMSVPDIEKKGAGVLRDKPNIKWDKDRGKDVESAPWFNLFKGERINNHHLKLAEKNTARKGV